MTVRCNLLPYNYGKVDQLDTGQSVAKQADEAMESLVSWLTLRGGGGEFAWGREERFC